MSDTPRFMKDSEAFEPWTPLATRIPKSLHRRLKLHCVTSDTSVMAFVVAAIEEKLERESRRR
jgi:predicted HicB family RNase H-like nuclease